MVYCRIYSNGNEKTLLEYKVSSGTENIPISEDEMCKWMLAYSDIYDRWLNNESINLDTLEYNDWKIKHSLIVNNKEKWIKYYELLVNNYNFVITNEEQRKLIWECTNKFDGKNIKEKIFKGYNLSYALKDDKDSFLMTQCLYSPESIYKKNDEVDVYEFAFVIGEEMGIIKCCIGSNSITIKEKRGFMSYSDNEIENIILFYAKYSSIWEKYLETEKKDKLYMDKQNRQAIAKMSFLDLERKSDNLELINVEYKSRDNDSVKRFCEEVSQYFACIYGLPFIPHSEGADEDKERVLKICKARYPELEDDYILQILSTVCWLSNR